MKLEVMDYETTGVDARTCEPVQVASMLIDLRNDGSYDVLDEVSMYLKIKADTIPPGAQAVHGISKETTEAEGYDPYEIIPQLSPIILGYNNNAYDDHISRRYGAEFELSFDLFPIVKRLKSMNILGSGKLGNVYRSLTGRQPENAHDALGDVRMTAALIRPLMHAMNVNTFSEMVDHADSPIASLKMLMPFGKHKGTPIGDLPTSYCIWAIENLDHIDADLKASLELMT